VYLVWREDNQTFGVMITEEGLANAELQESAIELEDHEGASLTLQFHNHTRIVPICRLLNQQPHR